MSAISSTAITPVPFTPAVALATSVLLSAGCLVAIIINNPHWALLFFASLSITFSLGSITLSWLTLDGVNPTPASDEYAHTLGSFRFFFGIYFLSGYVLGGLLVFTICDLIHPASVRVAFPIVGAISTLPFPLIILRLYVAILHRNDQIIFQHLHGSWLVQVYWGTVTGIGKGIVLIGEGIIFIGDKVYGLGSSTVSVQDPDQVYSLPPYCPSDDTDSFVDRQELKTLGPTAVKGGR